MLFIFLLRKRIKLSKSKKIVNAENHEILTEGNIPFEITVHSKIELREYIKLNFLLIYSKRPIFLIPAISGIAICCYFIAYYLGYNSSYSGYFPPNVTLLFGIFFASTPLLIYFQSEKNYRSNTRLHEDIEYRLTNERIYISGESFNAEMTWSGTYKIEELSKWFLIY